MSYTESNIIEKVKVTSRKDSFVDTLGEELQALATALSGTVILPGDEGYQAARAVWNARVDCYPYLIVQAATTDDVVRSITFARQHELPLAVRGAGHHPCGFGTIDDGLVLDLSQMKGLSVNPEARTATVEPGVTSGEFFAAIHAHGLVVTVGSHPTVGMTGFTLGGGVGLLMSRYGLACDNLLSAEIVTADGIRHTVSETRNEDLFWAIRGGGGNFGVVTSLTYQLHPVEPILGGMILHPIERAPEVLRFFRDFCETAPDELGACAAMLTTPDGHRVCALMVCYSGSIEEGERTLAPLRSFGPPIVDMVQPMPYIALLDFFKDADPAGGCYDYTVRHLYALTDRTIDTITQYAATITSPGTAIVLYHKHGAASWVPIEDTAYAARHIPFMLGIYAGWGDENHATHESWCRTFRTALEPHSTGTGYLNLMGDAEDATVRASYGANFERLQAIKEVYDPDNLFCRNPNIRPKSLG